MGLIASGFLYTPVHEAITPDNVYTDAHGGAQTFKGVKMALSV